MPSASQGKWLTERTVALREIQSAHASVGGTSRGRRYATQQINQAYVMLLSGQFQGFCRDLHTECVDYIAGTISPSVLHVLFLAELRRDRKLDKGNPSPGNIGSDFNRFGLIFWDAVRAQDARNAQRQKHLEALNNWRNAVAHQDFDPSKLAGKTTVQLADVRRWHNVCNALAQVFDETLRVYLSSILGISPW